MAPNAAYRQAFEAVLAWCQRQEFKGYDPYDGCTTGFAWLRANPGARLVLLYLNKFSPVNLRPALRIPRTVNLYALALINSALLRTSYGERHATLVDSHLRVILGGSLIDRRGYHCWNANGFGIQRLNGFTGGDVPGIVGTEACAVSILDYLRARAERSAELCDLVRSVRGFCLDVLLVERPDAVFFRYTPETPTHRCVYNASMKAAQFVLEANRFLDESEGAEAVERAYRFLVAAQKDDGSWGYSIDLGNRVEKRQIDFHQGFMLDGLATYLQLSGHDAEVFTSYRRGLDFYRHAQFTPDGQGLYRYPRKWPANIHNQAQGIVTFRRAAQLGLDTAGFAGTIADWTLRNMYDPRAGYFYFLKYPYFANRIPYLRWGQAWMLFALSHLLSEDGADRASSRRRAEATAP